MAFVGLTLFGGATLVRSKLARPVAAFVRDKGVLIDHF